MKIIKRSGKKAKFDSSKIYNAIHAVFERVSKAESSEIKRLTAKAVTRVKDDMHVEQIQDIVENVLIENEYIEEAKSYIRYREQHAQKRKEWLTDDLALDIYNGKYQFEGESFEEFFDRVAGDNPKIRQLMKDKMFLPAGRILANRGLQNHGIKVTYSNCYVTRPPEDSIEEIIDAGKRLARTFSRGGGSGIDISKLRPTGAKVMSAAKTTSGSVSFLDIYDVISKRIGQKGRRAALMTTIDCMHPDIEEFIDKKHDLNAVTKANMSVKLNDEFMEKAINNKKLTLKFDVLDTPEVITKEVNAGKLLNKMAYSNWYSGEPGALFWDTIEDYTILSDYEDFEFAGTNPCGEEPLPAGGSCLLGAINLSRFVNNEFKDRASFNYDEFEVAVTEGVSYLNEILEEGLELHPLKEQRESVRKWRQIGLGLMGLGDMFIKMGIRYGSKQSLELSEKIGNIMINKALQASALLAKDEGTFPGYDEEATFKSEFIKKRANETTKTLIRKYGLRNSQLLTIAPTGSISNICGTSGGIEPIYNTSYVRTTKSLHGGDREYKVFSPVIKKLMEVKGIDSEDDLPDYVTDAHRLNYKERIKMQSTWQKYIDASISSTVNLANETTVEEIKNIYIKAWENGLKGITIFRDGCARAGILKANGPDKDEKVNMTDQDWIDNGICPECKNSLDMSGGCKECTNCGFQLCGV